LFKNIKPAKEFQEQIDILKSRNIIPDDSTLFQMIPQDHF